jgi:hypothetical protein
LKDGTKIMKSTKNWNPIHFATYYGSISILTYFFETLKVNPKIAMRLHEGVDHFLTSGSLAMIENAKMTGRDPLDLYDEISEELSCVFLSIEKKDLNMFNFLLNSMPHLWSRNHLQRALEACIHLTWVDGIFSLLKGQCFLFHFHSSISITGRLRLIEQTYKLALDTFTLPLPVRENILSIMTTEQPMASLGFYFIIKEEYMSLLRRNPKLSIQSATTITEK